MQILPGFGGGAPSLPAPAPPPPTAEDPSVKAAAEKARLAGKQRKGLVSTDKTATGEALGDTAATTQRNALLGE